MSPSTVAAPQHPGDATEALTLRQFRRFPRSDDLLDRRLQLTRHVAAALDDAPLAHGLRRADARALHAGLFERGEGAHDDRTERVPPALVDELHRRFEAAMAAIAR